MWRACKISSTSVLTSMHQRFKKIKIKKDKGSESKSETDGNMEIEERIQQIVDGPSPPQASSFKNSENILVTMVLVPVSVPAMPAELTFRVRSLTFLPCKLQAYCDTVTMNINEAGVKTWMRT